MIQRRQSFSATAPVVPEPAKKSATNPLLGDEAFIILSSNCSGFWVS